MHLVRKTKLNPKSTQRTTARILAAKFQVIWSTTTAQSTIARSFLLLSKPREPDAKLKPTS